MAFAAEVRNQVKQILDVRGTILIHIARAIAAQSALASSVSVAVYRRDACHPELHIEEKVDYVAILDDILLALATHFSGFTNRFFILELLEFLD